MSLHSGVCEHILILQGKEKGGCISCRDSPCIDPLIYLKAYVDNDGIDE